MANLETLTIMFTDIVGFSDLVAKLPRSDSRRLLETHDRVLSKVIRQFGGRIIKSIGDSFLVTFRSPTNAVLCGMAMHDVLQDVNKASDSTHPIVIRVALNAGEVRLSKSDVFGDAVNIAARLEGVTPPHMVYLTEAVYLSMSKSEANLEHVGAFEFKGAPEKISVYKAAQIPVSESPEGATSGSVESDYPYGGMHLHSPSGLKSYGNRVKALAASGLILALTVFAWMAIQTYDSSEAPEKIIVEYREPDSEQIEAADILSDEFIVTSQLKEKSQPFLETGDYLGLQDMVQAHQQQYGDNAYLQLLSAHTDMVFQRYDSALNTYRIAFDTDPTLSSDLVAVKHLMTLLELRRREASKLIAEHLNSLLVIKLGERTGQQGLTGRYDAFYLLRDSGNSDAVDLVGLNIWDLRELDDCQLKKVAVVELKRLKDPRALDALDEALNVGFFGRIKYSCLRKDAKEAIALIEGGLE